MWLSHPTWYVVPTTAKDSDAAGGGTKQGRIVCKKGAHQTDPPEIETFRRSRWFGGVLLSMDLSQIELRVPALLTGEPFYLNAFVAGWDLHSRAAVLVFTEPVLLFRYPELAAHPIDTWAKLSKPFNKRERQVGKRTNFAHLFRSGPDTMQEAILGDIGELLPLELFIRLAQSRATALPVLWAWQEDRIREAQTTGAVTLPLTGQSRAFLGGDKYEVNEIVNFPIQTTAGNTLLAIQAYIMRALLTRPDILCYLNVYDALYFDCRTPAAAAYLQETLIPEAVAYVATRGYWASLQNLYGRTVPLAYEVKRVAA